MVLESSADWRVKSFAFPLADGRSLQGNVDINMSGSGLRLVCIPCASGCRVVGGRPADCESIPSGILTDLSSYCRVAMMGELPTSVLLPYGVVTPPVMDVGEAVLRRWKTQLEGWKVAVLSPVPKVSLAKRLVCSYITGLFIFLLSRRSHSAPRESTFHRIN
jgi:hypothetical protein